jgi:methionyl-tRNA formyltransferase
MKIGFVTCVQLGLSCMEALYRAGGRLAMAMTLTDSQARQKSGRVYLDEFCSKHSVPLRKVRHINDPESIEAIKAADLDWLFIIGWSQIAGAEVLASTRCGVLGMHPTLLPVGRGRAAIPWAILKGLPETGVSLFKLDTGVDTGPIAGQVKIALGPQTDAAWLYAAVDAAHVQLMRETVPKLLSGSLVLTPQDDALASEWPGRTPEDGRLDLEGSVATAERLIRAVTRPYPGAFVDKDGRRVIVWKATLVGPDAARQGFELAFSDGRLRLIDYTEA